MIQIISSTCFITAKQACTSLFSRSSACKQPKHLPLAKLHTCVALTYQQRFSLPFLGSRMSADVQPGLHCDSSSSAMSSAQGCGHMSCSSLTDAPWVAAERPLPTERLFQGMQGTKVVLKIYPQQKPLSGDLSLRHPQV